MTENSNSKALQAAIGAEDLAEVEHGRIGASRLEVVLRGELQTIGGGPHRMPVDARSKLDRALFERHIERIALDGRFAQAHPDRISCRNRASGVAGDDLGPWFSVFARVNTTDHQNRQRQDRNLHRSHRLILPGDRGQGSILGRSTGPRRRRFCSRHRTRDAAIPALRSTSIFADLRQAVHNEPMWDERFAEPGFAYGTKENDFLASVADRIPPGRVLSLAEGEGRNAVFLASLGFDVTAVDTSSVGLEKARVLAAERGVSITTIEADLASFAIEEGGWQGIVSVFCHMPPPLRKALHRRCVAGLAPGGVFALEGFHVRQLEYGTGGPKDPDRLFSLDELRGELDGLDLVVAQEIDREIHEGRYHKGTAAVVQILARRA